MPRTDSVTKAVDCERYQVYGTGKMTEIYPLSLQDFIFENKYKKYEE